MWPHWASQCSLDYSKWKLCQGQPTMSSLVALWYFSAGTPRNNENSTNHGKVKAWMSKSDIVRSWFTEYQADLPMQNPFICCSTSREMTRWVLHLHSYLHCTGFCTGLISVGAKVTAEGFIIWGDDNQILRFELNSIPKWMGEPSC